MQMAPYQWAKYNSLKISSYICLNTYLHIPRNVSVCNIAFSSSDVRSSTSICRQANFLFTGHTRCLVCRSLLLHLSGQTICTGLIWKFPFTLIRYFVALTFISKGSETPPRRNCTAWFRITCKTIALPIDFNS